MTDVSRPANPVVRAARRAHADGHAPDHFGRLLCLLVLDLLVSGNEQSSIARITGPLLIVATLFVAVTVAGLRHAFVGWVWGIVIGAGVVAAGLTRVDATWAEVTSPALTIAVFTTLLVVIMRRVLAYETVTLQTLFGALCVYLLIGATFSAAYRGLDVLTTGPLLSGEQPPDYTYFSFVTLTTVGFGDVAALTRIGRRVTIIEAMVGQVFLATAVARLVSLFRGRQRSVAP